MKVRAECLYVVRRPGFDGPCPVELDGRRYLPAFQRLIDAMLFCGRVCPEAGIEITDDIGALFTLVEASAGSVLGVVLDPRYDERSEGWSYGVVTSCVPTRGREAT